jgi:hypothetical protein
MNLQRLLSHCSDSVSRTLGAEDAFITDGDSMRGVISAAIVVFLASRMSAKYGLGAVATEAIQRVFLCRDIQ